jgi:hypothetical protein
VGFTVGQQELGNLKLGKKDWGTFTVGEEKDWGIYNCRSRIGGFTVEEEGLRDLLLGKKDILNYS